MSKIKEHRSRIRKEEEDNSEYGLKAEENLNHSLQETIFKKGKERRKGDEMRAQNLKNRFPTKSKEQEEEEMLIEEMKNLDLMAMARKDEQDENLELMEELEKLARKREQAEADLKVWESVEERAKKMQVAGGSNLPAEQEEEEEETENLSEAEQLKRAAQALMSQAEDFVNPGPKVKTSVNKPPQRNPKKEISPPPQVPP